MSAMSTDRPLFGFPRLEFHTVTSTLDIAREQASRGAPHGTLIVASHQSAGRGRRGARWLDEPGSSALMTFVLRAASIPNLQPWQIPFAASLACAFSLNELGYLNARIKWPNDLTIEQCKVGGLMVETVASAAFGSAYMVGIGVNVAQTSFVDESEFAARPTSLKIAADDVGVSDPPNAQVIVDAVASNMGRILAFADDAGDGELMAAWRGRQETGHRQRGIALSSGEAVSGIYRDARIADGAGLLEVEGSADWIAVAPSPA
jgi:BirA family biotin operon repressor/biotin-[acetyl-CoA-carboxylase] ligase